MTEFTMNATSKMAKTLMYMLHTGKKSLWAGDVAQVMGCERKQVASLCSPMVRKGFLRMEWHADGQHYTWAAGLVIDLNAPYLTVSLQPVDESAPELDWAEEFLKVRRSWVKAEELPPPFTNGVRSVFDLAGMQDHV